MAAAETIYRLLRPPAFRRSFYKQWTHGLPKGIGRHCIKPQPLPPVIHPHSGGWRDGGVPHSRSHDGTPRAFPPHLKRQEAVRMASLAFSLPQSAPQHRDEPVMSADSPLRGRFFNQPLATSPPHPARSSFTSRSTPPIKRMAWRSPKNESQRLLGAGFRSLYQESVALGSVLRPTHHPSCGRLLGKRPPSRRGLPTAVIYRRGFMLSIA